MSGKTIYRGECVGGPKHGQMLEHYSISFRVNVLGEGEWNYTFTPVSTSAGPIQKGFWRWHGPAQWPQGGATNV